MLGRENKLKPAGRLCRTWQGLWGLRRVLVAGFLAAACAPQGEGFVFLDARDIEQARENGFGPCLDQTQGPIRKLTYCGTEVSQYVYEMDACAPGCHELHFVVIEGRVALVVKP
jgi:hypothetical protein